MSRGGAHRVRIGVATGCQHSTPRPWSSQHGLLLRELADRIQGRAGRGRAGMAGVGDRAQAGRYGVGFGRRQHRRRAVGVAGVRDLAGLVEVGDGEGAGLRGGAVTLPVRSTPEALRRVQKSVPRHPWRGARGIGGVPSRARATAMLAGPPPGRARSASSSELDRTGSVKASATHSPRTVTLTGAWGRAPWCLSVSLRKSAGREGHRNGWPDAALAQVLTCHSRRT